MTRSLPGFLARSGLRAAPVLLGLWATLGVAGAGTTGRLIGKVTNSQKEPLGGANVILVGVPLGAVTEMDGRFSIINIPAGTYSVKAALIGHQPLTITDVVIPADRATALDIVLAESAVQMAEVVVSAKRPVVDVNLTSNIATLSREDITRLPVQELKDLVNLQAGVIEGHFRGGRLGEVQYQIDGVTANNLYDNTVTVKLDRSVLEEVQVVSGTFDAEYGSAMSGVVNAVLRRGRDTFEWSGELLTGAWLYPNSPRRANDVGDLLGTSDYEFRPGEIQNYQMTLSGPLGLPQTTYMVSGRRYLYDDYLRGRRVFNASDRRDSLGFYHPTGDGAEFTLGHTREWSGLVKLSNRSIRNVEMSYQAVANDQIGQRADTRYQLLPDGRSTQRTFSIAHGLDWTQTLNKSSFYKLSLRHNYFEYHDYAYEDLFDPRYDAAGALSGSQDVAHGAYTSGVDFARFKQMTSAAVLAGSLSSQLRPEHFIKFGGELQYPVLQFGNQGHLVFSQEGGVERLTRYINQPPDYPDVQEYRPWIWGVYAQDDSELEDLRLRAGLRLEYFDPMATLPSDLANPANSIEGAPPSPLRPATRKYSLMPRLGLSYPITPSASVFFAYGHFSQMPPLGDIYRNADYSVLATLQAGAGNNFGLLGNPDVKPERTVQYQFGYKQAVTEAIGADVTLFYKDIRDLLGLEYITTYSDAEYTRLTNVDFGSVAGFTVAIDQRPIGWLRSRLDYTFQVAQGNSSDPEETAIQIEKGADKRPRSIPLNWDQRHTFNLSVELTQPGRFSVGAIVRAATGQPYTPTVGVGGFGSGLEANSGRKPPAFLIDLRGERPWRMGKVGASFFGRVFNLLDTPYFNGFVFQSTGSPYYGLLVSEIPSSQDPLRLYAPRRIELGLTFMGGGPK